MSVAGGHDTFVFQPQNGNDFIYDFQQGQDVIELDGFFRVPLPAQAVAHIPAQAAGHLLVSFSDLDIATADTNNDHVADSSVVDLPGGNSVTVLGVTHLAASDFHIIV